jgi:hypothetical protein
MSNPFSCQWCLSREHDSEQCPLVKRIEHYASGALKLVEFHDKPAEAAVAPSPMEQLLDPQRGIVQQMMGAQSTLPDSISVSDMAGRAQGKPL